MPTIYPWERRWLEIPASKTVNEAYHHVESSGYVAATVWRGHAQELIGVRLQDTGERRVLVLLGEPGIGKSSEWRKLRHELAASAEHLFLNLGEFASENELQEAIVDDPKTRSWQLATGRLTLWLDSLDEGLLHMRRLQHTLGRLLRRLPVERLYLRITCRNAVWPAAFTEDLGNVWQVGAQASSEHVSVLLLRPLTQEQVTEAAQAEGLLPEAFLTAVAELDAQPLSSIPVTLRLLLSLYKKHQQGFGGAEAAGRAGLYARGCLELCYAPDGEREGQPKPDGQQRLLLAGYLAYLAVFSNRRQIYLEPARGEVGENALDPYAARAQQTAPWQGQRADISPTGIADLLRNTSLFTDLGNGCMAWVHQAFAEFLAAWYLQLTAIPMASLRALFRSEADPAGGVVPALRETAAWLSELQPAFWQELLRLDPLALVRSDLRRLRHEQRADVVQQLVAAMATLAYPPYLENRERSFIQQLAHPGLAAQLEPLLTGNDVPSAVVRFAMDMAKGCRVQELVPALLAVVLDSEQPFYKRAHALDILRDIMPEEAKPVLRPLIYAMPDEDERDEFRGDLLWTLWPAHLAPDELLPLLTTEKDDHYGGAYRYFIHELNRQDIQFSAASVQTCLRWLSEQGASLEHRQRRTEFWARLSLLIWQRAWQLIDEPGVKEAAAAFYATEAKYHEYASVAGASAVGRRAVFETLLAYHYQTTDWVYAVSQFNQQKALVSEADWDLLMPLVHGRMSGGRRTWVAKVLRRLLTDSRYLESVARATYCQRYEQFLTAARKYASVRAVWREWFKPVVVTSAEARKDRKEWLRGRKRTRKAAWKQKNRRREILRKIGNHLQFMRWLVGREAHCYCKQWHHVLSEFQQDKTEKNTYHHNTNPGESKRWRRLGARFQKKMLDRLWEFIGQYPVPPTDWYGPGNRVTYAALVLREGLVLLLSRREELLRSQPPVFWQGLAPFLVWFDEYAHEGPRHALLHLVATHAPQEVDSALVLSMDMRDDREHGSLNRFADWYGWLPGARFPALLLAGIAYGVWNEGLSAQVLTAMLEVNYAPAWEYVREWLAGPAVGKRPKFTALLYGSLLFRKTNHLPDVWQYWEWLSEHLDLARTVISTEINHPSPRELTYLAGLREEELEALVLWLTWAFDLWPTDVDDWGNNNPRGKYAGLRSAAAAELADRGTASAWGTLKQLDAQLGNPFWLRVRLDQVRENVRRNGWVPARPEELIELSQQVGKRLVKSATDLQELVVDSLQQFQADLHNELAVANMLWIPQKQGNKQIGHKVQDENSLSDVLRLYLTKDLRRPEVLIKREVEIRKSVGMGTGQRTDLFIEAFVRDEQGGKTEVVTVVIEVKLARNDETETALQDQLLPYLQDQPYKHGIYLVGWHYGQYDPLPAGKLRLAELHRLLQQQTASVPAAYTVRALVLDMRLAADNGRSGDAAALFEII
jgi:hypothetical protein